jgi:hypothetical protein
MAVQQNRFGGLVGAAGSPSLPCMRPTLLMAKAAGMWNDVGSQLLHHHVQWIM